MLNTTVVRNSLTVEKEADFVSRIQIVFRQGPESRDILRNIHVRKHFILALVVRARQVELDQRATLGRNSLQYEW